jgi:hypothetical protein
MRQWCQRLGLWIAGWGGWVPCQHGEGESSYTALLQAHVTLVDTVTQLIAERDQARDDFQAYAQKNLGVRADLRARADYLVRLLHRKGAHLSGEFKRHQVYADLIKEFPDLPQRDLSLAIEMAVRARV